MERPEFILFFKKVFENPLCTKVDTEVFGYIYWFTKLKNEKCTASNETLAKLVGTTPQTIQNSLTTLEKAGFIRRIFRNNNKFSERVEIVPLMFFGQLSSTGDSNYHPQVIELSPTGDQSKSIEKEQTSEFEIRMESEEIKTKRPRKYPHSEVVFALFSPRDPHWVTNTTQLKAAEELFERGIEKVKQALKFYYKHKDEEYCPKIRTPHELNTKWLQLISYADSL